jgi:hypothetical protein
MTQAEKIDKLLKLHCKGCGGGIFGCKGCTKKEQITKIIKSK